MMDSSESPNRARRHAVNLFVGYDFDTPPFGRTRDLSITGIFVETDDRPDVDATVDIHMVWGDDNVSCQARVVRHDEAGIGLAFIEPNAWFSQCVEEILDSSPPIPVAYGPSH